MVTQPYKLCLLIDDNYIDNLVTRRILENGKFAQKIVVTDSAQNAINQLSTGEVKPDVIFLDIRMPGMDGFEFLDEYDKLQLADKADIKIFMLSSSLDPVDFKQSSQNKYITQFLHKPITQKVLESLCQ